MYKMLDQVATDNLIEDESTSVPIYEKEFNISDPNDLVRFPGFGFWQYWYFEAFKKRREAWENASNISTADENIKVSGR